MQLRRKSQPCKPQQGIRNLVFILSVINGYYKVYYFLIYFSCNKLSQTQRLNTNVLSYNSGGQKSEMTCMGLKSRCLLSCLCVCVFFFSESPKGESIPGFFQIMEVAGIPWLMAASLQLCFCCYITSSPVYLTLLPPCYKNPCDYSGST